MQVCTMYVRIHVNVYGHVWHVVWVKEKTVHTFVMCAHFRHLYLIDKGKGVCIPTTASREVL